MVKYQLLNVQGLGFDPRSGVGGRQAKKSIQSYKQNHHLQKQREILKTELGGGVERMSSSAPIAFVGPNLHVSLYVWNRN
jgi:hypothetical protein